MKSWTPNSDAVHRAFRRYPALAVLYHEFEYQASLPTRELDALHRVLGVAHRTAYRYVRTLVSMGLIGVDRPDSEDVYEVIVLRQPLSEVQLDLLGALAADELQLEVATGTLRYGSATGADRQGQLESAREAAVADMAAVVAAMPDVQYFGKREVQFSGNGMPRGVYAITRARESSLSTSNVVSSCQGSSVVNSNRNVIENLEGGVGETLDANATSAAADAAREPAVLTLGLTDLASLVDQVSKRRRKKATPSQATPEEYASVVDIFDFWRAQMGYPECTLGAGREKIILARLRAGWTVEQLKQIIAWAARDPWMRGTDPRSTGVWDDFPNILGSNDKAEKYLKKALYEAKRAATNTSQLAAGKGAPTTRLL